MLHDVRLLTGSDQFRTASSLFRGTLHLPPATEEHWPRALVTFQAARTHGVFAGDQQVGTASVFPSRLRVPGGGLVPMDAVSRVGVRADWTRRGILTALIRAQLTGTTAPIATLRATEGGIYRRFGYGVTTRSRRITVLPRRSRLHPGAPDGGAVRLLTDPAEVTATVSALQGTLGVRHVGGILLPEQLREFLIRRDTEEAKPVHCAVHTGPEGEDGFVAYTATATDGYDHRLRVLSSFASTPEATAGLWRFLLGVDLVQEIVDECRPVDDPIDLLLADPRACRITALEDETWLRVVDAPAALAARGYGPGEPVVIELTDELLPANSGNYLISPEGAQRTDRAAQLRLDPAELATLYLGDLPPSALAAAGRLRVLDQRALPAADLLFTGPRRPWCGSFF